MPDQNRPICGQAQTTIKDLRTAAFVVENLAVLFKSWRQTNLLTIADVVRISRTIHGPDYLRRVTIMNTEKGYTHGSTVTNVKIMEVIIEHERTHMEESEDG